MAHALVTSMTPTLAAEYTLVARRRVEPADERWAD
jgi:hypothetical protein